MLRGNVLACVAATVWAGSAVAPTPATPVEPISALIRAFESHAIVAVGENPHGSEQLHSFLLSLIRDPRFASVVNDIVVEFGNARYQDMMDRFVRGDDVPRRDLQRVWRDTTQVTDVWDRAVYEEFYRAVRDVNVTLPREQQLRVLLGDPPVDWERGPSDAGRWTPRRTEHAAQVVLDHVVAKNRRALLIYGGGHLVRIGQSIVGRVERASPARVFTVTPLYGATLDLALQTEPMIAEWQPASLATLAGTLLNKQELVYWDAVLYVGLTTSRSPVPRELCEDRSYVSMRLERLAVVTPGAIRHFRAACAIP
jgi:hypothetical protein